MDTHIERIKKMKIITDAGFEINENQIDIEYAKTMINAMLDIIITESTFKEDALKELSRVERRLEKAQARAALMASSDPGWEKCRKAFEACGYTGAGVTAYMNSRKHHDPMDDDPNRFRG